MEKNWYKSKTIWVGIVTFLLGGFMALESVTPGLSWVIMGKGVLDIILRFITEDKVIV